MANKAESSAGEPDAITGLLLCLVAASGGKSPGKSRRDLHKNRLLAGAAEGTGRSTTAAVDAALDRAIDLGSLSAPAKPAGKFQITQTGLASAASFLGLAGWPRIANARALQDFLLARAAGINLATDKQLQDFRAACKRTGGKQALLLRAAYPQLPALPTLNQATAAILHDRLGVAPRRVDLAELVEAAVIGRVRGSRTASATSASSIGETAMDPATFARSVRQIASELDGGRFGDKVFIAHVERAFLAKHPGWTPEGFREQLVAGHRAGVLELSRADLVEALPTDDVSDSELSYLNARFHFINLQ